MKLWRMISPILIAVMLLVSQFSPVMAMQTELTADATSSEANVDNEGQATATDPYPATEAGAELLESPLGSMSVTQSENIPIGVTARTHPESDNGYRLVIPTVMDDSDLSAVKVRITNPNRFWVTLELVLSDKAYVSEALYPWGQLYVIPPENSADFVLDFSETEESSIQFFANAGVSGVQSGGAYTAMNFIVTSATGGVMPLDRWLLVNLGTWGGAPISSTFTEIFKLSGCGQILNVFDPTWIEESGMSPSSLTANFLTPVLNCITSDSVQTYLGVDERASGLWSVATLFSDLVVSGYQIIKTGTISTTVIFESEMIEVYGTVIVHQVDQAGDPVAGGCYVIRASVNPDSLRLGGGCDASDGNLDGDILVRITQPAEGGTLRNAVVVQGYIRPPDKGVEILSDQVTEYTVELERGTSVTVLVVDEDRSPVSGACFDLTPFAMGDSIEQCDSWDGAKDGQIVFDRLATDQFLLTQTVIPFNYRGFDGGVIEVERDVPQTVTIVNAFNGYGSLAINLSGSDGSLPVGACFNVVKIEQYVRTLVARLCDEGSEVIELTDLMFGEYELESAVVPSGYAPIYPLPFVILGGQQTTLDVRLPIQGSLEVHHVDEFGVPVSYGCFELTETYSLRFGEQGIWKTQKCDLDGNGVTVFEGLRPGEYQVEHIQGENLVGWSNSWTTTTHARASRVSVVVEEAAITSLSMVSLTTVTVRLHIQGEVGEVITGACYQLGTDDTYPYFGSDDFSYNHFACDADDGALDGIVTILYVPPGSYEVEKSFLWNLSPYHQYPEVVEITVPESAKVSDYSLDILDAGSLVVSIVNELTGDPTSEGIFELYGRVGDYRGDRTGLSVRIGNESGYVNGHIPPGDYYLVSNLEDMPATPITIIAKQETNATVIYSPTDLPYLHISTVDELGELLPGACYTATANSRSYDRCDIDDGVADGITIVHLPKSWTRYFVSQRVVPPGKANAAGKFVSVDLDAPGLGIDLTFDSSVTGASLTISTVDSETGAPVYGCYSLNLVLPGYVRYSMPTEVACTTVETADDVIRFVGLPEGQYELWQRIEVADQETQQVSEYPWQTISLAAGEQRTLEVRNRAWPTLEFHSTHPDGENLLGACYQTKPLYGSDTEEFCDEDDGAIDGIVRWDHRIYPYIAQKITGHAPSEYGYGPYDDSVSLKDVEMPIEVQYTGTSHLVIDFVDSQTGQLLDGGSICRTIRVTQMESYQQLAPIDCKDNLRVPLNPGRYWVTVEMDEHATDYIGDDYSYSIGELTLVPGEDTHGEVPVSLKPNLVIQNRDSSGAMTPGICYYLVEDIFWWQGVHRSCDDNNDGTVVFAHLYPRKYTLREDTFSSITQDYVPVEDIDIWLSPTPGDAVLTVDRLRAGSLRLHYPDSQCIEIWEVLSNGQYGSVTLESYCGIGSRLMNRMVPGSYVVRVKDTDGNILRNVPFIIVGGQQTTIEIRESVPSEERLFTLHVPDFVAEGETAVVRVAAIGAIGDEQALTGYVFRFFCGDDTDFIESSTSMQTQCLFPEVGGQIVSVEIERPDGSSINMWTIIHVKAVVSTETPTPTETATSIPSETPTEIPTEVPTETPTEVPPEIPTETPTEVPTEVPSETPTEVPSETPTEVPTESPTEVPSETPTGVPSETPTEVPSETPTEVPTETPTEVPTATPILLNPGTPILQGNACVAGEYVAPWIDFGVMPDNLEIDRYVDSANGTFMVIATIVGDDRAWPVDSLPAGWTTTYNPAAIVYNGSFVPLPCTEPPTEVPYASPIIPTAVPTQMPTQTPPTIPTPVPTAVPTEVVVTEPTGVPTELPTSAPTSTSPTEGVGDSIGDQSLVVVITLPNGQSIEGAPYELYGATASMSMLAPVAQGVVGPDNTIVINDILPGQYRLVVYLSNTAPLQLSVSVGMTPLTLVQVEVKSDGSVIVTDTTSSGSGSQTPGGSGTGAPAAGGSQSVSGLPSTGAGPGPTMLIPLAVAILCLGILSSWRPVRSGLKRVRGR